MHYGHLLTINRLRLHVHLGFYEEERGKLQPIEINIRMYFPEAPPCALDDHGKFLDYGAMCAAITQWATAGEYRLLEFMGLETFKFVRAYMNDKNYGNAKLWLELIKCEPPVPGLQAGTSFIHSDLGAGATTVMCPVL